MAGSPMGGTKRGEDFARCCARATRQGAAGRRARPRAPASAGGGEKSGLHAEVACLQASGLPGAKQL
eukprot:15476268-Alexandrium_andersonii.AAC.1